MDALVHLVWCTTKVKWQPFVLWEIFLWPYHSNNFLQVARWKVVSFTTSAGCCMTPLGSIKVMDSNSRSRACLVVRDASWPMSMGFMDTSSDKLIDMGKHQDERTKKYRLPNLSGCLQTICKQYNISLWFWFLVNPFVLFLLLLHWCPCSWCLVLYVFQRPVPAGFRLVHWSMRHV